MQQIYSFALGIILLVLGIPIGDLLAKITKEELKPGKKWFNLIILICLIFSFLFLILGDDVLLFTMLFIAVVVSRSLKK